MGLQQEAEIILKILYDDFNRCGKSIGCLSGSTNSEPIYFDYNERSAYRYKGLHKNKIFSAKVFSSVRSFNDALLCLEREKHFIIFSDNDPILPPEELLTVDHEGRGAREHVCLTLAGYMEADKNSPTTQIPMGSYFYFTGRNFYIETMGTTPVKWNLSPTKEKGTDVFNLFSAFVRLLDQQGRVVDHNWYSADISRKEIRAVLKELDSNKKLFSDKWFKTTKGNIIRTMPEDMRGYVALSTFNRSTETYNFKIKLPI